MGLGQDFLADPSPEWYLDDDNPNSVWLTEDGRYIPIVDLTDDHLINIKIYLEERNITIKTIDEEYKNREHQTVSKLPSNPEW